MELSGGFFPGKCGHDEGMSSAEFNVARLAPVEGAFPCNEPSLLYRQNLITRVGFARSSYCVPAVYAALMGLLVRYSRYFAPLVEQFRGDALDGVNWKALHHAGFFFTGRMV